MGSLIGELQFNKVVQDFLLNDTLSQSEVGIAISADKLLALHDFVVLDAVIFTSFNLFDRQQITEELVRLKQANIPTIIISGDADLEDIRKSFEWVMVIDKSRFLDESENILPFINGSLNLRVQKPYGFYVICLALITWCFVALYLNLKGSSITSGTLIIFISFVIYEKIIKRNSKR